MLSMRKLNLVANGLACLLLLSMYKISFLVGTQTAHFSLAHCIMPLIGLFLGGLGATAFFAFKTLSAGSGSFLLACHLPTLSASLYLAAIDHNKYTISWIKKLLLALIPMTCMTLFVLHPVGWHATPYALFWVIPLISLMIPHQNLFFHMLGSTFTAHAVGSVLWLYAGLVPDPNSWIALIPVVMLERFLFASGMFVGYTIIHKFVVFPLEWSHKNFSVAHLK